MSTTWRFDGHIAGVGTASGTRLVIGMWHATPFGELVDVMVENPVGHRTLLAPTQQAAGFISATYEFDEVRVEPVTLTRTAGTLRVSSSSVDVTLRTGRRTAIGWMLVLVPRAVARSRRWARLIDPMASRLRAGVHTHGSAGADRHEYYCALDERAVASLSATFDGVDLGRLAPLDPPVRFGFGSAPRTPAVVRVTTLIDTVTP